MKFETDERATKDFAGSAIAATISAPFAGLPVTSQSLP